MKNGNLFDLIDVTGEIVTIDAMGCQMDIASKIRQKEADYVLANKDNQLVYKEPITLDVGCGLQRR